MATLRVKVVPGARADRITGRYAGGVKIQVSAPPEDGKANKAVLQVLAAALKLKLAQLQIISGHTQARKVIAIEGMDQPSLDGWLNSLAS
jgi:uncharacterized protein (TIGR00251 family)